MYKVVGWVLQFAPIGVFALIAVVFGKQGANAFGPLLSVTSAVYIALIVHIVVIYGGILALNKISFKKFISKAKSLLSQLLLHVHPVVLSL